MQPEKDGNLQDSLVEACQHLRGPRAPYIATILGSSPQRSSRPPSRPKNQPDGDPKHYGIGAGDLKVTDSHMGGIRGREARIVIILVAVSNFEQSEDAALMRKVADQDRQAFLRLYDKHAAKVYGLALRVVGDPMTAEEVTQDAFVRLWTRAETFNRDRGRLSSWLLTITRRIAIDQIRLEARRPPEWNPSDPATAMENVPDPASQSEESRWATLRFALDKLPDEQRSVIELAFYHGMSHSQIADYQSTPLGTVKTRLRLGMEKLRREWEQGDTSN